MKIATVAKYIVFLLGSLFIRFSFSNCLAPSGQEGSINYNTNTKVHDYCDGTNWKSLVSEGIIDKATLVDPDQKISSSVFSIPLGNYLYVFQNNPQETLFTMDISDKENPIVIASLQTNHSSSSGIGLGNYLYVLNSSTLYIYNITNPISISLEGSITNSLISSGTEIDIDGNYLYLSDGIDGMTIIDVTDRTSPVIAGNVKDATQLSDIRSIAVSGNYAYALTTNDRLTTIDISNALGTKSGYKSPSVVNF